MVVSEDESWQWFDPMEIEFHNNSKRKSHEETEGITAMTKDSFELHVQKVLKTGPAVGEHAPGNTGEDKENNNCLVEISCNSADTSDSAKTAKLRLLDICSANKWNSPTYELCEVVGPNQNIMFKYKVTVLINTYSLTVLDCFSAPNCEREAAQEHAAEGALWYLNHLGYCS
ncbi:uncharacterized protein LOC144549485 [Carex rostrata]